MEVRSKRTEGRLQPTSRTEAGDSISRSHCMMMSDYPRMQIRGQGRE